VEIYVYFPIIRRKKEEEEKVLSASPSLLRKWDKTQL
jgi:hypothetical protein